MMNKEQIKNTALGLAALVTINTAGCSNLATKKDIEESNKKISSIDTHNKERFDEIESLIKKSQEEANKKAKEVAGIDFNKGESIYTLNIEAGTIKKVYSKEGLLVRDQVTGKTYTTDQDTILFIIPGVNKNDITLENLPKKGTNLRDIEDKEVKNYTDFTKKYADELKPEKTGIQNIIVADFDCNGEVRIRSARIVPKTKIEEVKKEEVKKEVVVVEKRVVVEKIVEKQPEAPRQPEQKKPEQPKQPEAPKKESIFVGHNVEWEAQPGWIVSGDIEYWNGSQWIRLYDNWTDYPEGQDRSGKTADIVVIKNKMKIRGPWGFTRSRNIPLEEIKTNKENETDQKGNKIFDEVRVKHL